MTQPNTIPDTERAVTPMTEWTDLELLAEYNRYSLSQRRARFRTKDMAIMSIRKAKEEHAARGTSRDEPAEQPRSTARRQPAPEVPKRVAGQRRSPKNV